MNFIRRVIRYLNARGFFRFLGDEGLVKMLYWANFGKKLDLNNPKTFNEKLQWLKLNDRKDIYTIMVDKYEVKKYVANIIGEKYIIPTLGVYDSFDDIDFDSMPSQFVIKCTHDSGGLVIVDDKSNFDKASARKKINSCLKRNYYLYAREWPYKNVKPRIIVEKYLVDESGYELKDYKFFCFNGIAKYIQVDFNRFSGHKKNIYDRNWVLQDVQINYPNDKDHIIEKPKKLTDMIKIAELISRNNKYMRVDFYNINNSIYFGEITFFPGGGFMPFNPEEMDYEFGKLINLNERK